MDCDCGVTSCPLSSLLTSGSLCRFLNLLKDAPVPKGFLVDFMEFWALNRPSTGNDASSLTKPEGVGSMWRWFCWCWCWSLLPLPNDGAAVFNIRKLWVGLIFLEELCRTWAYLPEINEGSFNKVVEALPLCTNSAMRYEVYYLVGEVSR